jgi:GT2 family glycosyltransferase
MSAGMTDRVLAVIPVYGNDAMTHELVADLTRERDLVDITIVDNRGDYTPAGDEAVIWPGENLGWAGGTNHGTRAGLATEHSAAIWLNNDTRLAEGCVSGLVRCWRETGAGLVGPFYDCWWNHQRLRRPVPVEDYRPRSRHVKVPFLDGTCMLVPRTTIDRIGLLDADTFAPLGWGAEIDYGLRARAAGLDLVVTRLSYLHHEKSVTGKTMYEGGLQEYGERGYPVAMAGLERKWGPSWREAAGVDAAMRQTRRPWFGRVRASRPRPSSAA